MDRDTSSSMGRGRPIAGHFSLRLGSLKGIFCFYREKLCPCFREEVVLSPVSPGSFSFHPDLCSFRPLSGAEKEIPRVSVHIRNDPGTGDLPGALNAMPGFYVGEMSFFALFRGAPRNSL